MYDARVSASIAMVLGPCWVALSGNQKKKIPKRRWKKRMERAYEHPTRDVAFERF